ncbi:hypothetical protein WR25_09661 isoform E [Diploscapter pachys]|uniref:Uncharacterized protein n=1 Tax=Diploscapter pachys TaxID=2018661 RepID=A0A2A2J5H5_9BILA|nr:hypothetical protein WR25_09661 isoform E [Diploscapter pachys]
MISHVRRFWPKHPIIFYDFGLKPSTIKDFKKICNLEVRTFPFEKFPPYVKNMLEYRWKPLAMALVLKEFKSIWYMDSSIRWLKPEMYKYYDMLRCKHPYVISIVSKNVSLLQTLLLIYQFTHQAINFRKYRNAVSNCTKSEYLLMNGNYHGIYSTTNFGTYDFLPTDKERLKEVTELQAGFALIARTKDAMDTLKWYVLCALEKECMAPKNSSIKCKFGKDMYHAEPTCHRYFVELLLYYHPGF